MDLIKQRFETLTNFHKKLRYKNNYVFSTFFFNYLLDKKNETYQYEKIIKWLQKRNININNTVKFPKKLRVRVDLLKIS